MAVGGKSNYKKKSNNLKYQISIFGQWLIWVILRKHEEGQGSRRNGCKAPSHNLGPSLWNNHQFRAAPQTGWERGTQGRPEWRCRSTRQNVLPCDLPVGELISSATQDFGKKQPRCQLWWQLHPVRKRLTELQRAKNSRTACCCCWLKLFSSPHKMCIFKWSSDKSAEPKTKQSSFII